MMGVHEDKAGDSTYWYSVYRRGSIVTNDNGRWGVVMDNPSASGMYHPQPRVSWLTDGKWATPYMVGPRGLSAPYVHTYEGIPDEVLARATYVKLVDTDHKTDTTDSNRRT